jgi:hypothetical protein
MRFANVQRTAQPQPVAQRGSAMEFMRRLAKLAEKPGAAVAVPQELPADLDQRVRLVGEW